jgi:predicted RNase H-like nuclease (RuvC/YqgF family)
MDEVPLEDQIAQAELQTAQVKNSNASMASQIADAQAINRELGSKLEVLRIEREKEMRNTAYLSGLYRDNDNMQRELARMEGREYSDPDKPDGEWPCTPEEPRDF